MYCDACGTEIQQGQRFCRACGKPAGGVPLVPAASRIAGHIRMLGILWLAISAFRLIPAGALLVVGRTGLPPGIPEFVYPLISLIGGILTVSVVAGFFTGWGLLTRQPWGRTLALISGGISLIDVPFGTALGIYTLWVLLPSGAEEEYRRVSQKAA